MQDREDSNRRQVDAEISGEFQSFKNVERLCRVDGLLSFLLWDFAGVETPASPVRRCAG